jgi:replicative DNA helicase
MGLRPTQNLVIAGRPAMGKTALAVNILENISLGEGHYREFYNDPSEWPGCRVPRQGKPATLLVCLESSQVEMASRMLCARAQVCVQRIRDGLLGKADLHRIGQSAQDIGTSSLYIWDAAGISVEELELELKAFKMKVPTLAAVAVDHCGLLRAKAVKDAGNDYARTGYVSNRLRLLWKTLGVLGIPLWQLSREVEKRADKRPKLSDLRDSGKIEEDASQVIMPYRPAYYDEEAAADEAFIIIAKNRGGPTSAEGVKVRWEAQYTRFSSLQSRLFSNDEDQHQHNF